MRFNRYISREVKDILEKQYLEYIKITPMSRKEKQALRKWVKDGNSVYENSCGAWADGGVPIEFLTVFRDEEYIRKNTKGMSSEERRKFALEYYGWDDDEIEPNPVKDDILEELKINSDNSDNELPF